MDRYIGFKMIQGEPAIRKGGKLYSPNDPIPRTMDSEEEVYRVIYPDNYESYSPKAVFEAAYMKIGENCTITQEMVDNFIKETVITTIGDKTTLVKATLINGFEIVESSSCVDPANYNESLGAEICIAKIKDKIWYLLGFLLQTARYGIRRDNA